VELGVFPAEPQKTWEKKKGITPGPHECGLKEGGNRNSKPGAMARRSRTGQLTRGTESGSKKVMPAKGRSWDRDGKRQKGQKN